MKYYFFIATFGFIFSFYASDKIKVYMIPGQGADCRLFGKLEIDTNHFEPICLPYSAPPTSADMSSFAQTFIEKIDTTNHFILIGVSLGGMIATEIAHSCHPLKTIIISSAKHKNELPVRYRFQQKLPIYQLFPPALLKKGALLLQPIVEPDRKKFKSTFVDMLSSKSPIYFKSTIRIIVNWKREKCNVPITHIHGEKDHTIPLRNVSNALVIENGSHMMTLTRHQRISHAINNEINIYI